MEDTVGKMLIALNNKIDNILSLPPEYEQFTLPDGFSGYKCINPRINLLELDYDFKQHTKQETMDILKEVLLVINVYYKDSEIRVKCEYEDNKCYELIVVLP